MPAKQKSSKTASETVRIVVLESKNSGLRGRYGREVKPGEIVKDPWGKEVEYIGCPQHSFAGDYIYARKRTRDRSRTLVTAGVYGLRIERRPKTKKCPAGSQKVAGTCKRKRS